MSTQGNRRTTESMRVLALQRRMPGWKTGRREGTEEKPAIVELQQVDALGGVRRTE